MSRFSTSSAVSTPRSRAQTPDTFNAAGSPAYKASPKLDLVSFLLTSFVQDAKNVSDQLRGLIAAVDPKFAAKAAIYARDTFGMRSVAHIVAGEIAKNVKGEEWTKNFFDSVVVRTDDVTEILAYYIATYGRPIPNSLKKGLGKALLRQNEHSLAKYRKDGAELTLIDAVNLVFGVKPHPKKKPRKKFVDGALSPALGKLVRGELEAAETWETGLTVAGNAEDVDSAKAEVWADLVKADKLGYLAMLRNLRNLAKQADAKTLAKVLERLKDPERVAKSRVFPFQVKKAYDIIQAEVELTGPQKRTITDALQDVIDVSVSNVPALAGDTVVVLDVSGSMKMNGVHEIAGLFTAILAKATKADVVTFDDRARYVQLNLRDSVMSITRAIPYTAGGTNLNAAFAELEAKYDRIIVLSDMQNWVAGRTGQQDFASYCQRFKANPKVYSWDLKNSGTLQFPEQNVFCLAGWSDKVFDLISSLEQDRSVLVNEVEAVVL